MKIVSFKTRLFMYQEIPKMLSSLIFTITDSWSFIISLAIWRHLLIISLQTNVCTAKHLKILSFLFKLPIFTNLYSLNLVYSAPFFPQLLDAWSKRHHPNMHFVFYEDLKKVTEMILHLKNYLNLIHANLLSGLERRNSKNL